MAELLNEQELHNLAMNIVGKDLEEQGFEFLAVNSKLKKNPQFVALKDKKLHFVIVKAITYPENVNAYDQENMDKMRDHALKFNARTFYANVGLGSAEDYSKPLEHGTDYAMVYNGIIEYK